MEMSGKWFARDRRVFYARRFFFGKVQRGMLLDIFLAYKEK